MKNFQRFFLAPLIYTLFMFVFFLFQYGPIKSILGGIIAGLMFGIFYYFYQTNRMKKQLTKDGLDKEQVKLFNGANYVTKNDSQAVRLYLLSDRLVFIFHKPKTADAQKEIPLEQIQLVETDMSKGLFFKGLSIRLNSGELVDFRIFAPKKWKAEIENAMTNNLSAGLA